MVRLGSPAAGVSAAAAAGLVCGVGGEFLGAQQESDWVDHPTFDAVVESADEGRREACLTPVDPAILDDFGGSVCGEIFVAPRTEA